MRNIIYPDEYLELIAVASKRGLTKKAAKELGIGGELHHIIPKCVAPELIKEKSNIVFLTYEEHYNAHKLLALANQDDAIACAWKRMCTKKETKEFCTAEDYANAKQIQNAITSKLLSGKKLSKEHIQKLSLAKKGKVPWNKGKPRIKPSGSPCIKVFAIEYPEIIFESFHDAENKSKILKWTGVKFGHFNEYFKGKLKSLGKDSNGNKLHWKKVET